MYSVTGTIKIKRHTKLVGNWLILKRKILIMCFKKIMATSYELAVDSSLVSARFPFPFSSEPSKRVIIIFSCICYTIIINHQIIVVSIMCFHDTI